MLIMDRFAISTAILLTEVSTAILGIVLRTLVAMPSDSLPWL